MREIENYLKTKIYNIWSRFRVQIIVRCYFSSHEAIRIDRIDLAIDAMLLQKYLNKCWQDDKKDVLDTYWYEEGRVKYFSLPDDCSVRLNRLSDTVLIRHKKIKLDYNPFLDSDGCMEESFQTRNGY